MAGWRAAVALLVLAAFIHTTAAAPLNEQTGLETYDGSIPKDGCYYNFQHYGEGDRIMTNEPCLNCTCHNRMLMCYLRVCPFMKPVGQDCTVEKRADQCCPVVTCPDVPVDLLTSTSTTSPAEYGSSEVDRLRKYGCTVEGRYFSEGSKLPPTPNKPCELCYCIRNMTACVMQECTLHVDGCTPVYHRDVCCPVRYSCDHPEEDIPLLDNMTTTERPTPGYIITTTTPPEISADCFHDGQIYPDGAAIKMDKACEHCYCMKGDMVCVVQECGVPMENEGKNCIAAPLKEGQCCPDTYMCDESATTTEGITDFTGYPFKTDVEGGTMIPFTEGFGQDTEPTSKPTDDYLSDRFATEEPSTVLPEREYTQEEVHKDMTEPTEILETTMDTSQLTPEKTVISETERPEQQSTEHDEIVTEEYLTEKPYDETEAPQQEMTEKPYIETEAPQQEMTEKPYSEKEAPQQEMTEKPYEETEGPQQEITEKPYSETEVPQQEMTEKPYEETEGSQQVMTEKPEDQTEGLQQEMTEKPYEDTESPLQEMTEKPEDQTAETPQESVTKLKSDEIPEVQTTEQPDTVSDKYVTEKPEDIPTEAIESIPSEKTESPLTEPTEKSEDKLTERPEAISSTPIDDISENTEDQLPDFSHTTASEDFTEKSETTTGIPLDDSEGILTDKPDTVSDEIITEPPSVPTQDLSETSKESLPTTEKTLDSDSLTSAPIGETTEKPKDLTEIPDSKIADISTERPEELSTALLDRDTETPEYVTTEQQLTDQFITHSTEKPEYIATEQPELFTESTEKPKDTEEPLTEQPVTAKDELMTESLTEKPEDQSTEVPITGSDIASTQIPENVSTERDISEMPDQTLQPETVTEKDTYDSTTSTTKETPAEDITEKSDSFTEDEIEKYTTTSAHDATETPLRPSTDEVKDITEKPDKQSTEISEDISTPKPDNQQYDTTKQPEKTLEPEAPTEKEEMTTEEAEKEFSAITTPSEIPESDTTDATIPTSEKPQSEIPEVVTMSESPETLTSTSSGLSPKYKDSEESTDETEDIPETTQIDLTTASDTTVTVSSIPEVSSEAPHISSTTEQPQQPHLSTEPSLRKEEESDEVSSPISTKDTTEEISTTQYQETEITASRETTVLPQRITDSTSVSPTEAVAAGIQTTESVVSQNETESATTADIVNEISSALPTTQLDDKATESHIVSTTVDEAENEIIEESTTHQTILPHIPGEGDCLVEGITYSNDSIIPSTNKCMSSCKCVSSIVKCEPVKCSAPPQEMSSCKAIYESDEACCPRYECDVSRQTTTPGSYNQMAMTETTKSEVIEETLIPIEQSPLCTSKDCPKQTQLPSEKCEGGDCATLPADKTDAIEDKFGECEGGLCGTDSVIPSLPSECVGSECEQSQTTMSPQGLVTVSSSDGQTTIPDSEKDVEPPAGDEEKPETTPSSEIASEAETKIPSEQPSTTDRPSDAEISETPTTSAYGEKTDGSLQQKTPKGTEQSVSDATSRYPDSTSTDSYTRIEEAVTDKEDSYSTPLEISTMIPDHKLEESSTRQSEEEITTPEINISTTLKSSSLGISEPVTEEVKYDQSTPQTIECSGDDCKPETTDNVDITTIRDCQGSECTEAKSTTLSDRFREPEEATDSPILSQQPDSCEGDECKTLPSTHTTFDSGENIQMETTPSAFATCTGDDCKVEEVPDKTQKATDKPESEDCAEGTCKIHKVSPDEFISTEKPSICTGDECTKSQEPQYDNIPVVVISQEPCNGDECDKKDEPPLHHRPPIIDATKADGTTETKMSSPPTDFTEVTDSSTSEQKQSTSLEPCIGDYCKQTTKLPGEDSDRSESTTSNIRDQTTPKGCIGEDCQQTTSQDIEKATTEREESVSEECFGDSCKQTTAQEKIRPSECVGTECEKTTQYPSESISTTPSEQSLSDLCDGSDCKQTTMSPSEETQVTERTADEQKQTSPTDCDGSDCAATTQVSSEYDHSPESSTIYNKEETTSKACVGDECYQATIYPSQDSHATEAETPGKEQTPSDECVDGDCKGTTKYPSEDTYSTASEIPEKEQTPSEECIDGDCKGTTKYPSEDSQVTETKEPAQEQISSDECLNGDCKGTTKYPSEDDHITTSETPKKEQTPSEECIDGDCHGTTIYPSKDSQVTGAKEPEQEQTSSDECVDGDCKGTTKYPSEVSHVTEAGTTSKEQTPSEECIEGDCTGTTESPSDESHVTETPEKEQTASDGCVDGDCKGTTLYPSEDTHVMETESPKKEGPSSEECINGDCKGTTQYPSKESQSTETETPGKEQTPSDECVDGDCKGTTKYPSEDTYSTASELPEKEQTPSEECIDGDCKGTTKYPSEDSQSTEAKEPAQEQTSSDECVDGDCKGTTKYPSEDSHVTETEIPEKEETPSEECVDGDCLETTKYPSEDSHVTEAETPGKEETPTEECTDGDCKGTTKYPSEDSQITETKEPGKEQTPSLSDECVGGDCKETTKYPSEETHITETETPGKEQSPSDDCVDGDCKGTTKYPSEDSQVTETEEPEQVQPSSDECVDGDCKGTTKYPSEISHVTEIPEREETPSEECVDGDCHGTTKYPSEDSQVTEAETPGKEETPTEECTDGDCKETTKYPSEDTHITASEIPDKEQTPSDECVGIECKQTTDVTERATTESETETSSDKCVGDECYQTTGYPSEVSKTTEISSTEKQDTSEQCNGEDCYLTTENPRFTESASTEQGPKIISEDCTGEDCQQTTKYPSEDSQITERVSELCTGSECETGPTESSQPPCIGDNCKQTDSSIPTDEAPCSGEECAQTTESSVPIETTACAEGDCKQESIHPTTSESGTGPETQCQGNDCGIDQTESSTMESFDQTKLSVTSSPNEDLTLTPKVDVAVTELPSLPEDKTSTTTSETEGKVTLESESTKLDISTESIATVPVEIPKETPQIEIGSTTKLPLQEEVTDEHTDTIDTTTHKQQEESFVTQESETLAPDNIPTDIATEAPFDITKASPEGFDQKVSTEIPDSFTTSQEMYTTENPEETSISFSEPEIKLSTTSETESTQEATTLRPHEEPIQHQTDIPETTQKTDEFSTPVSQEESSKSPEHDIDATISSSPEQDIDSIASSSPEYTGSVEASSELPSSIEQETDSSAGFTQEQPTKPSEPTESPEDTEQSAFPGGYGEDYGDDEHSFGPGTCKYGGKVYVSAQQIPRDNPCDFCFCFRSDIICLQQSCPPPIPGCHEEPIEGFCCPRYECPVSMATSMNITTTTTTTTTTLPPHFLPHAYKGAAQKRGCHIKGQSYQVGEVVTSSSGPCMNCTCRNNGQMECKPKACTPEPMLRQMIAAAVATKRRR